VEQARLFEVGLDSFIVSAVWQPAGWSLVVAWRPNGADWVPENRVHYSGLTTDELAAVIDCEVDTRLR